MADMDISEVTVGSAAVTGAIWVAPEGTTLPTDASTTLSGTWQLLGFTSDAGVTISESATNNEIRAWEGRTNVFNARSEYTESISFMPIQCNSDVAKLMWGDDAVAATSEGFSIKHHSKTLEPVCIVIETAPREDIVKRFCGTFQLTERGNSVMDGTQVDGRTLTFNALADEDGVTMYEYCAITPSGATN